ncbi:MAG: DNA polymerase I [Candidatus Cloacimonas sp. 4484_209]|nr:MAG: DNA polymerase I [Candidatus Cloacimonas sp. 4484_209]
MDKNYQGRIILIDGSAMVYRAYFAFINNPLKDSKGKNTSAVFGMVNSLLKIIKEHEFTHIALSFDTSKPTERHRIFKEYKATREKMPDELKDQLPKVKEVVNALGIPIIEIDGYEADDVLGTLARCAVGKNFYVTLVTFDKDFFQLLSMDGVEILKPARGKFKEEIITAEDLKKKLGISPDKVIDYLALVGDVSDNIPGVRGVGGKTAARLLNTFGSLERILENKNVIKPKRIVSFMNEEQIYLSKKLVTINTDVKLGIPLDSLLYKGKDIKKLREIFTELEFTSLMDTVASENKENVAFEELPPIDIVRILNKVSSAPSVFELFNYNNTLLLSFALSEDEVWVSVFNKEDVAILREAFYKLFSDRKQCKISSDIKSTLHILNVEDVALDKGLFDLSVASYLIDPSRNSHSIDFIALRYTGNVVKKKEDLLKAVEKQKIEQEEVKQELSKYTSLGFQLYKKLQDRLEKEEMKELFYRIEMPLVSVLARMEKFGIQIDIDFFNALSLEYKERIDKIENNIYNIAGERFNVRSTKQLQDILFNKLKLRPPKRTKTGYSTDSETLVLLSSVHELPREILKYRELYKLKSTYIDTLPRLADDEDRIHTTFIQTTTSTGRLASRNPNLQNIPARGELGREIRKGFIAPDGKSILSCDYSQIELRILAHISGDKQLINAFQNDMDIHTITASSIFRLPEENITREMRRRAKIVNFGIIYGMSPYGLAQQLSITPEEGMVIINSYFSTYEGVKNWIDAIIEETVQKGFTETLFGRKRNVPELKSKNYATREFGKRIAINTPIQGTAADIIKLAMIRIDKKIREESIKARMVLQIHDELLFEVDNDCINEVREMVKDEMENVFQLSVPLKVDIGVGNNWFEAH